MEHVMHGDQGEAFLGRKKKDSLNLLGMTWIHVGVAWERTKISSRHVGEPHISVTQLCVEIKTAS